MKRKSLFISHVAPFPVIGGDKVRISQSLNLLSELFDVDVVYISKIPEGNCLRGFFPAINNEWSFHLPKWKRALQLLKTVINGKPFLANMFYYPEMKKLIDSIIQDYDMVFCASPVSAQYVLNADKKLKVLDMTDSLAMNTANASKLATGWRKMLLNFETKLLKRYEQKCLEAFNSVSYISEVDRDFIPAGLNKHIVFNAVKSGDRTNKGQTLGDKHLVFVGKMDYEPNITAVSFFIDEVMPLLVKDIPDIRFSVVGTSPTKKIKDYADRQGVEVTGFVESVTPWFEKASIVVAPMLTGSGVQNKILEALAHGCTVITTPIGFEGIESLGDVVKVVEPDASQWAKEINELLNDSNRFKIIQEKAPVRVEEEFGISKVREQFRRLIDGDLPEFF